MLLAFSVPLKRLSIASLTKSRKVITMRAGAEWFGFFFKKITHKSVEDCADLQEIERTVQESQGRNLNLVKSPTFLVHMRGNIFPQEQGRFDGLDQKIDALIKG